MTKIPFDCFGHFDRGKISRTTGDTLRARFTCKHCRESVELPTFFQFVTDRDPCEEMQICFHDHLTVCPAFHAWMNLMVLTRDEIEQLAKICEIIMTDHSGLCVVPLGEKLRRMAGRTALHGDPFREDRDA